MNRMFGLFAATSAGDALGYLTWAGPFTGEPIRALLVRGSVPVAAGVAAGAVERAIYNLTAGLLVGVVLLFLWVQILPATQTLAFVAMLVGALAITTAILMRGRARDPRSPFPVQTPAPRSGPIRHAAAFVAYGPSR